MTCFNGTPTVCVPILLYECTTTVGIRTVREPRAWRPADATKLPGARAESRPRTHTQLTCTIMSVKRYYFHCTIMSVNLH